MTFFSLSHHATCTLNCDLYDKDFDFIVGETKFSINKIFADLISPIVNLQHKSDPTFDSYSIPCDFNSLEFMNIIHLIEGREIDIRQINTKHMLYFFDALGNKEFLSFIISTTEEITKENAIDRLQTKLAHSIPADDELKFIASNLYSFNEYCLNELDVETLSLILAQQDLRICSEEWLYDFILKNSSKNPQYVSLFEYIEFRNLSVDSMSRFADQIQFDELNVTIWKSICKRLSCEIVPSGNEKADERCSVMTFEYTQGNELNGIFRYLSNRCGGNIAKKDIIGIVGTTPINSDEQFSPINVVDLDTKSKFYSKDEPDQSILFDFKDMRITPTHYSIRTQSNGINCCHMKNWVLELSEDGNAWFEVDRQDDSPVLNGSFLVGTFKIANPRKCRFIRIRQTGPNWFNDNRMFITGTEFFGKLYE